MPIVERSRCCGRPSPSVQRRSLTAALCHGILAISAAMVPETARAQQTLVQELLSPLVRSVASEGRAELSLVDLPFFSLLEFASEGGEVPSREFTVLDATLGHLLKYESDIDPGGALSRGSTSLMSLPLLTLLENDWRQSLNLMSGRTEQQNSFSLMRIPFLGSLLSVDSSEKRTDVEFLYLLNFSAPGQSTSVGEPAQRSRLAKRRRR